MRPAPLEVIDLSAIKKLCAYHINNIEAGKEDDDEKQYIYEAIMETLYGKDIFKYINSLDR